MPALCDIKINCLKCEGDHITMIFDRLNGYRKKKQKQKKLRGQPLLFPSKKKNEKVFHYKYDTGDYMIHNKLIPM